MLASPIREELIARADSEIVLRPITVTAYRAEHSAGGVHDFFSQADYCWPNPEDPTGPYISHDGQSNPDVFKGHRYAMVRLSRIVADLTSAWLLTGDESYARAVEPHVMAWFVDDSTAMAPHMSYAQACLGRDTGRPIGVIDSVHLIEVAQSLLRLEQGGMLSEECIEGTKAWFRQFIDWLRTSDNGTAEMRAANNHGSCWALQVAAFARYVGDEDAMEYCRSQFKNRHLYQQMAPDGSFPMETRRTKSYSYSIFNLDILSGLCTILSTPEDDLWDYVTPQGHSMQLGLDFIYPYIVDKSCWPYGPDVAHWDELPVASPCLVGAWWHLCGADGLPRSASADDSHRPSRSTIRSYYDTWASLEHFPEGEEVIRNLPMRSPIIWLY